MEQIFFQLHVRSVNLITRIFSANVRKLIEWSVLAATLAVGALLFSLHGLYVTPRDGGCLQQLAPDFNGPGPPPYQMLKISIVPPATNELLDEFRSISNLTSTHTPNTQDSSEGAWGRWRKRRRTAPSHKGLTPLSGGIEPALATYAFSLNKGWLLLESTELAKHKVVLRHVSVRADDEICMGGQPITRGILANVIGYDRVVSNWLCSLGSARGFVRVDGPTTGSVGESEAKLGVPEIVDLNLAAEYFAASAGLSGGRGRGLSQFYQGQEHELGKFLGFKLGVVLTTLFLFFTTTTLVSFTLRETQERMLKFTFSLHHHVRHNISYMALIASHMLDSLVYLPIMLGMLFFLIEFFGDQLLAFLVLTMVWSAEVYSVIALRTASSIRFFPRFFFLHFSFFSAYFFSFPFGFSYIALLFSFGLLFHAMLHFWNRFEVPALRNNTISALHPREASVFGTVRAVVSLRSGPQVPRPQRAGLRRRPAPALGSPDSEVDDELFIEALELSSSGEEVGVVDAPAPARAPLPSTETPAQETARSETETADPNRASSAVETNEGGEAAVSSGALHDENGLSIGHGQRGATRTVFRV